MARVTTFADRVKETSTTTGTGTLTLAGAVSQFQSFATAFGAAGLARVRYSIVGQTGTEWEVGLGTFDGTTGLTRDSVIASSNSDALVSLSAGTKDVFATFTGLDAERATIGSQLALASGFALP